MREPSISTRDLAFELRSAVESFVVGTGWLSDAERLLADVLACDSTLDEFTSTFTLTLAEFTSGELTEEELREELAALLREG